VSVCLLIDILCDTGKKLDVGSITQLDSSELDDTLGDACRKKRFSSRSC